jgi:hypothetical protein
MAKVFKKVSGKKKKRLLISPIRAYDSATKLLGVC